MCINVNLPTTGNFTARNNSMIRHLPNLNHRAWIWQTGSTIDGPAIIQVSQLTTFQPNYTYCNIVRPVLAGFRLRANPDKTFKFFYINRDIVKPPYSVSRSSAHWCVYCNRMQQSFRWNAEFEDSIDFVIIQKQSITFDALWLLHAHLHFRVSSS